MAQALTAPLLVASLVLCVAGAAKLRRPQPAAQALAGAGLPSRQRLVRAFAFGELGLGVWSLVAPGRATALALCGVFSFFTVLSAVLARRASTCGCFGSGAAPASAVQSLLSASFALAAAAAAAWPVHGLGWLLGRAPALSAALAIGLVGAAYATVLAYTALPPAWNAWEQP